ncbi:PREDICTED: putative F-box protein At1g70960 [Camelina sativa]|uniref:F-box protein At1g70960 n=1 Tax=Camelina sativa TaxID=90675 RepID=A0ABM0WG99_CAMSA|nr:PREDICTED: putative F-box protein At1g70960 [Camelina sativa]
MDKPTSFETLPLDLQMDILSRLPLKSLVKCIVISKQWASLIRGEDFKNLYLRRSSTRPRLMIWVKRSIPSPPEHEVLWYHSVYDQEEKLMYSRYDKEVLCHSVYQEEEPLLSSGQQQLRIPREPMMGSRVSQPVRGLICLQLETKFVICNPGTKMFRKLPEIQANESMVHCFFGYDEATKVFKVLCVTLSGPGTSTKYQVCTVGSGGETWRRIKCKCDHQPYTEGLFKGGVVYYGAHDTNTDKSMIMCFNLTSEKFSAIKLPKQINFTRRGWDVVNYNGKIAVSIMVDEYTGLLRIWARNEIGVWLKEDIVVSRWKETIETRRWKETVANRRWFRFKGTIGTKELVFAPDSFVDEAPTVLYYNTETQKLRRFTFEHLFNGPPLIGSDYVCTFLDHVDSTWLM